MKATIIGPRRTMMIPQFMNGKAKLTVQIWRKEESIGEREGGFQDTPRNLIQL